MQTGAPTPFYQTKQVLLNYYSGGFHTYFDMVHDVVFTRLVLYTDGQMIVRGGLQKKLSKAEMDQLFASLNDLGFYAIETDEEGNSTKNLYTPDNPFEKITDGDFSCVLTTTGEKKRNICPYGPYEEYLVPQMKNVLKFLDEYPTTDMTPYIPDRIVLYVESVETIENFDKSFLSKDVIEWPKYLTPLSPQTSDYKMMYVQGFMAGKISAYMDSVRPENGVNVFRQDGKDYVVMIDIILPHEEINFMYLQP